MNLFVPSIDTVRRRVSVPAVAHRFGLDGHGERFFCPFHDDNRNPNLVALPPREGDPVFRYFCNACGAKGDSLDLVRALNPGCTYTEALRLAGELIGEEPELKTRPEAEVPDESWEERIRDCQARALEPTNLETGLLTYAAGWTADATFSGWLATELEWGLDEGARVIMPHRDAQGSLRAVKVRCHPPEPRFRAHGPLRHLYGEAWADPLTNGAAILAEGESDTAHAKYQLLGFDGVDVFGLPAGASVFRDEWAHFLGMYGTVFVGIDPDTEPQAVRWMEALKTGHHTRPAHVRRLPIPDGHDLRSCGVPVLDLMHGA